MLFLLLALGIGGGFGTGGNDFARPDRDRLDPPGLPRDRAFQLAAGVRHTGIEIPDDFRLVHGGGQRRRLFRCPLNAIMQSKTDIRDRGGLLGATTYFTDSAMLLSSGLYGVVAGLLKVSPNSIFLIISLLTLVGLVIVLRLLPEELLRLVSFLLIKVVYRIRVFGRENIPAEGAGAAGVQSCFLRGRAAGPGGLRPQGAIRGLGGALPSPAAALVPQDHAVHPRGHGAVAARADPQSARGG